jgi:2-(1,2-epoxy-1,2-dihydrophenyl)acetyl-CoA isomerase
MSKGVGGMVMTGLRLDIADGLAQLTFTEAARGNPIDGPLCASLSEAAIQISENRDIRCVLLAAEGKAFSYGGDLGAFVSELDELAQNIKRWTTTLHSSIARFQRMDAPLVAAVHGVCAGGMAALIAGSDVVIATDTARFMAAYAGIGFSCDAGSSIMFSRRMGPARARRFLLLNETLSAAEALGAGLVDEVVPPGQLQTRAQLLARQLAAGPTRAFGEIRRLLLSAPQQPLETQLELEAQALARIAATSDARNGLTAFAQKRKPEFQGR